MLTRPSKDSIKNDNKRNPKNVKNIFIEILDLINDRKWDFWGSFQGRNSNLRLLIHKPTKWLQSKKFSKISAIKIENIKSFRK